MKNKMANLNESAQNSLAPGAAIAAHQVVAMLVGSQTVKLGGFTPPTLTSTPIWIPAVDLAAPAKWPAERRRVKRFLRWALVLGVVLAMAGFAAVGFVFGHVQASSNVDGGQSGAPASAPIKSPPME